MGQSPTHISVVLRQIITKHTRGYACWHGRSCTSVLIVHNCRFPRGVNKRPFGLSWTTIVWTIRSIRACAFANDWNIRAWKTPLKNDKYHTFEITIYYELNKPKKWKKNKKMGKKHKNVWITFAFIFQHVKTNVMLNEHEFYVLWLELWSSSGRKKEANFSPFK